MQVSLLACRNSCSSAKYCSDSSVTEDFVSRSPENTKERGKFSDLQNLGKYQSKPHKTQSKQNNDNEKGRTTCQARDLLCGLDYCIHSFPVLEIPSDPTWLCHLLPGIPHHCHFTTPGKHRAPLVCREASDEAAAPLLGLEPLALGQQFHHTSKGS